MRKNGHKVRKRKRKTSRRRKKTNRVTRRQRRRRRQMTKRSLRSKLKWRKRLWRQNLRAGLISTICWDWATLNSSNQAPTRRRMRSIIWTSAGTRQCSHKAIIYSKSSRRKRRMTAPGGQTWDSLLLLQNILLTLLIRLLKRYTQYSKKGKTVRMGW